MEEFTTLENASAGKKKRKSINKGLVVAIIILSVAVMLSALLNIYVIYLYKDSVKPKNEEVVSVPEVTYTKEEVDSLVNAAHEEELLIAESKVKAQIKEVAEKNNGVLSALREIYPEYFVYYENNHYVFVEPDPSIAKPNFENENLVGNEGFIDYKVDGEVLSVKGIDVSQYQGDIDWEKVAESGVRYVMLRAGLRGYGTGKIVTDDNFEENIKGATKAGLEVGVYFFTQAINEAEAREEAEYVLDLVKDYDIAYPIAVDVEDLYNDKARSYNQSKESRTSCAMAFMDTINNAGYRSALYGNLNTFTKLVDINKLGNYEKWFAQYDTSIYFPYEISIWQYTDKGTVDGIEGNVDLNITFPKNQ